MAQAQKPTTIPRVSEFAADAICEMLLSDQGMNRPPVMAARILALICALHKKHLPFPKRVDVARAIGAPVATVDAALNTRIADGYITPSTGTRYGNVQRRNSSLRERYYVPSPQVMAVYDKAIRLDRREVRETHTKGEDTQKPQSC